MKKIIFFAALFILAACAAPTPQVTVTPEATLTAPPTNTPAPTASPQPEISAEVQAKFDGLGLNPQEGVDKNGNPIYFVTNPAGEQVTVAVKNAEGKYELGDSLKYKLYATVEEAEASGIVMDTEYVLRGGPGQAAKLNGEPFPEDVLTGLNIVVTKPNFIKPDHDILNFDEDGIDFLRENPEKAPYRNMGWFVFKDMINGDERSAYGCVWQWINSDGSIVYITTIISSKISNAYEVTPFASFNFSGDIRSEVFLKIINNPETTQRILEWADTDTVLKELGGTALIMSFEFK